MRDQILDATERLLVRYGYAKMTMEDLAREAGIGKGTIYLHFPSKEEVVLSRLDRMVERLVVELRAIAASRKSHAERLKAMLVTRVMYRFDAAKAYAESMDEMLAAIRPGLLARREKHFAAEAEVFAELLADGFVCKDVSEVAQALILATNALLPYSLTARQLGRRSAVEQKANAIATLLIDGLRRKA
jgi:AcrR family transcriptional regulator